MTNHAISQTRARHAAPDQFSWSTLFRNWYTRRKVKSLQDRDDRTLDDIGVTRDEIMWAAHLPLSVNAANELERASYRRRKEEQLKWL